MKTIILISLLISMSFSGCVSTYTVRENYNQDLYYPIYEQKRIYIEKNYYRNDYDRRDYNRRDYDRRDYDRRDYDSRNYDSRNYDRRDYYQEKHHHYHNR